MILAVESEHERIKIAQSKLGTDCVELIIGYNGVPHIRTQNYPLLWTDPQTQLLASSLDTSDLLS